MTRTPYFFITTEQLKGKEPSSSTAAQGDRYLWEDALRPPNIGVCNCMVTAVTRGHLHAIVNPNRIVNKMF